MITVKQLAEVLNVPTSSVYSMIQSKTIRHYIKTGERRKQKFVFGLSDLTAILITRDLVEQLDIGRDLAADISDWIMEKDTPYPTGQISISVDLGKYRATAMSHLKKFSAK